MAFAKGPYTVRHNEITTYLVGPHDAIGNPLICELPRPQDATPEQIQETLDTANLLAASTRMFDALEVVAGDQLFEALPSVVVNMVRHAIAKAKGELPTLLDQCGSLKLDTNSVSAVRQLRDEWDDKAKGGAA